MGGGLLVLQPSWLGYRSAAKQRHGKEGPQAGADGPLWRPPPRRWARPGPGPVGAGRCGSRRGRGGIIVPRSQPPRSPAQRPNAVSEGGSAGGGAGAGGEGRRSCGRSRAGKVPAVARSTRPY